MQIRQDLIRRERENSVSTLYIGVNRAVFMSQAVIIAKGNQWAQFELHSFCTIQNPVLNNRRVLARDHEYGFLDNCSIHLKRKYWKRIEPELL